MARLGFDRTRWKNPSARGVHPSTMNERLKRERERDEEEAYLSNSLHVLYKGEHGQAVGVSEDDPQHRDGSDAVHALQRAWRVREREKTPRVRVQRETSVYRVYLRAL